MSETKHTPWELGRVEDGHGMLLQDTAVVFTADGGQIEVRETPHADEIARLIAAAPDLLEALANIISEQDNMGFDGSPSDDLIDAARLALSRATPREGE